MNAAEIDRQSFSNFQRREAVERAAYDELSAAIEYILAQWSARGVDLQVGLCGVCPLAVPPKEKRPNVRP